MLGAPVFNVVRYCRELIVAGGFSRRPTNACELQKSAAAILGFASRGGFGSAPGLNFTCRNPTISSSPSHSTPPSFRRRCASHLLGAIHLHDASPLIPSSRAPHPLLCQATVPPCLSELCSPVIYHLSAISSKVHSRVLVIDRMQVYRS
jgi:hypothetical protein